MFWAYKNRRVLAYALAMIILAVGAYLLWQHYHPAQTVTYTSQQAAEQPATIQKAADSAHVPISQQQSVEAATAIHHIAVSNKKPDSVVQTTGSALASTVRSEQQKSGADFAVVTDPQHTDKTVDPKKIPASAPVTLNQYNVFAYPQIIRGGAVYPYAGSVGEVSFDVSRRITAGGKYLGVVIGYDIRHREAKAGVRYVW